MASARLSNLIKALQKLAKDSTRTIHSRTQTAEREIKDYLVKDPVTRKQMLDELDHEVAAETGELWDTVRDFIAQWRRTG